MRQRLELQLALGAIPIERVEIPTGTRDELPPTLAALQWVFTTPQVSSEIFQLLEKRLLGNDRSKGRPGMELWQIKKKIPDYSQCLPSPELHRKRLHSGTH